MKQRITIAEVLENDWFKKGYKAPSFKNDEISLDNIDDIFNESEVAQVLSAFFFIHVETSRHDLSYVAGY